MSTRGLYTINGTTIYIHHDNYLEGAASYLYNALSYPVKGGLAESLIRSCDRAGIVTGPKFNETEFDFMNFYGAEFYYVVKDGSLSVYENTTGGYKIIKYTNEPLDNFIEKHREFITEQPDVKLVCRFTHANGFSFMTRDSALRKFDSNPNINGSGYEHTQPNYDFLQVIGFNKRAENGKLRPNEINPKFAINALEKIIKSFSLEDHPDVQNFYKEKEKAINLITSV